MGRLSMGTVMQRGTFLDADDDGEGRYRLEGPIADGRRHQVVRCVDTEMDDRVVAAKAPRIEPGEGERESRTRALQREADVLKRDIAGFPDFVDLLEAEATDGGTVPVLLYEYLPGETLFEYVAKRPREVLELSVLLAAIREVGAAVRRLHEAGFLLRNFDPRHVIVDEGGGVRGCVGTNHVTPVDEAPIRPASDYTDAAYVAPEARQVRSGETLQTAVDVYGLAAMTSFVCTGEEPLSAVESPLNGRAYELLGRGDHPKLAHLVGAGLQPVAKHRVDLETYVTSAELDALPEEDAPLLEEGRAIRSLPEPWAGAHPPGANRAEGSHLSPGPLISVSREEERDVQGREPAGLQSAPVREFTGETDRVGNRGDDEAEPVEEVRRDAAGEPAREVSMLDEHLPAERSKAPSDDSRLPDLADLPFKTRVSLGVGLPLAIMFLVIALGLLGVY